MDEKYLAGTTRCSNVSRTGMVSMERSSASPRYMESAFVMITCEECTGSLVDLLRSIPEVKEVQPTCGNYDVIIKVETETAYSMRDVIEYHIRKIPGIRATTVLISSPILIS